MDTTSYCSYSYLLVQAIGHGHLASREYESQLTRMRSGRSTALLLLLPPSGAVDDEQASASASTQRTATSSPLSTKLAVRFLNRIRAVRFPAATESQEDLERPSLRRGPNRGHVALQQGL
jgi:hypothetical protein